MFTESTTRWNVTVSRQTDVAVRNLFAQRGRKQGTLSRFIEDAVRWRIFDQSTSEARQAFSDMTPDSVQELLNEATASLRDELR